MRTRKFFGLVVALAICTGFAYGQGFEEATRDHESRLDSAIQRLNTLREEIVDSQIPLAKHLNETREETKELRREFGKQRAAQDSRHLELDELTKNLKAKRKEVDYISRTLMGEYFANYEAELSSGEQANFGEVVRNFNLLQEDSSVSELETLEKSLVIVNESLDRIYSVLGGKKYEGEALNSDGILVSGTFIQAGPVLYFSNSINQDAGLVDEGLSLQPRLRKLDTESESLIVAFASGDSNTLPVDPSLENAILLQQTKEGVLEHLKKGGVWVYPIMFFAFLSTVVAVYKFIQIFAIRQPDPLVAHQLSRLLRSKKREKAMSLAKEQPQPARAMLVNAVEHSDEPVELVEEVMYESMLSVQPKLERFLNVIAVTAATAPLLGLLGTVTGIIKTFKLMNVFGAGDPKPLIAGISEALITTELGLILAIPALIIHALLSRKVAGVLARMEKLSVALTNSISRSSTGGASDV